MKKRKEKTPLDNMMSHNITIYKTITSENCLQMIYLQHKQRITNLFCIPISKNKTNPMEETVKKIRL